MTEPRLATPDDADVVGLVCAEGFWNDPVLSWAVPDPETRHAKLAFVFSGLARDMSPADRGSVYLLDDACAALWRDPDFDHHAPDDHDGFEGVEIPLDDGDIERFARMDEVMKDHHPREPHWYLNVVSTRPDRQGRGLGAAVLEPVLARCDADRVPAYLESTNPRNRTLYRRAGFVDVDEVRIPDGPTMTTMWREPLA